MTLREFIDAQTGKPDDRAWLDYEIHAYVDTGYVDMSYLPTRTGGKQEDHVYSRFAPVVGRSHYQHSRPSWENRNRKIKRAMIAASINRLIANGSLRVVEEDIRAGQFKGFPSKRAAAFTRSQEQVLGASWAGPIRLFRAGNVLDGLVNALSQHD